MLKKLLPLVLVLPALAQPPRAMLYLADNRAGIESFMAHRRQIDVLVPTWYHVDANGLISGKPNLPVLQAARQAHVSVIPIVVLMDKNAAHQLIGSEPAQDAMNQAMLRECREHRYDGIQFDLENILSPDRDGLTRLVERSARLLHANHLQVQIAVVPSAPGHPGKTAFSRWMYEEWRGAYDLQALGKVVDAIGLMTYDQHTKWTVPGPVGGWRWTNQNLAYALQFVPKEKLYLGIALYGYHWFTGDPAEDAKADRPNVTADDISQSNALRLMHTYAPGEQPQWDAVDHTEWFYFYRDQMREWVFYTGPRGFRDRYQLAADKKLAGFCAWVLGDEDPGIWLVLPRHH